MNYFRTWLKCGLLLNCDLTSFKSDEGQTASTVKVSFKVDSDGTKLIYVTPISETKKKSDFLSVMVGLSDKTLYSFSFNGRYLQAEMRAQSTLWGLAAGNPRISRLSFDFENGVGTASYLIDAPYSQRDEETPSWSAQFKCNSPEDVSKFLSQLDISSK